MISQSPWKALDGPSTYSPDWDPRLIDPASDWLINDRGACSLATLARHKAPAIGPPRFFVPRIVAENKRRQEFPGPSSSPDRRLCWCLLPPASPPTTSASLALLS
jgi:hypothetical protein